jgi:uncharacterized linocin/CFP29 family protein
MTDNNSQVPWSDEQWDRVKRAIQEEANRARVAATFLQLFGPLPANTDFVRREDITVDNRQITIADTDTIKLPTLQVKVYLRGAQMADPDLTSALALFQRAANLLARLEDAVIFNGQPAAGQPPAGGPNIWEVLGGQPSRGLLAAGAPSVDVPPANGQRLVTAVSEAIGKLEADGHFGPFAVALGQQLFLAAQTPNRRSLVLPQDRIIPFLGGGGSLVRSSTLPPDKGVVVALGGAPVELVIATDVSLNFLQVTPDPMFVFRVYEKMVLRIKEPDAIIALVPPAAGPVAPPAAAGAAAAPGPAAPPAAAGAAAAPGPAAPPAAAGAAAATGPAAPPAAAGAATAAQHAAPPAGGRRSDEST